MSKICVFVYNSCRTDARVLKEAETLADQGHEVKIIAVLDKLTEPFEQRRNFTIVRVEKNPWHYRVLKRVRFFFAGVKRTIRRTLRRIKRLIMFFLRAINAVFQFLLGLVGLSEKGEAAEDAARKQLGLIPMLLKPGGMAVLRPIMAKHPIKFILFGWIVFLLYNIFYAIRYVAFRMLGLIISLFYAALKKFLMVFHRPLCYMDYYKRGLKIVLEDPAEIYHGHDLNALPLAYLSQKKTGGKVVYDSHELYTEISTFTNMERKMYRFVEKRLAPKMDRVITVNESIAGELSERYKIPRPTVVMNCPVVKGRVNPDSGDLLRNQLNIAKDVPMVLYQGGFAPNRGLENLVKAAAKIDKGVMVFMGWGILEAKLIKLAAELGLEKKLFFIPPVSQEELLDYTKSADVGVIPYQFVGLNNYYTSPNKLFEYINAGVCIAGSNFPELVRVIDTYDIGKTFDPESPDQIAKAINSMLEDPVRLKEMIANTANAAKRYTWEVESKKLVALYNELSDEINN